MKVLIVDDDALVTRSLRIILSAEDGLHVVGTARDGAAAVAFCDEHRPDAVLMDIRMPGMDGIEATRLIKRHRTDTLVMMLTTFKDEELLRQALKAGAAGYVLKSAPAQEIAGHLRALASGCAVVNADLLRRITEPEGIPLHGLTRRETEITELVAQGCSNRGIGERLFISEGTVRNVLSGVLSKLDLRDRTQLAIFYWTRSV